MIRATAGVGLVIIVSIVAAFGQAATQVGEGQSPTEQKTVPDAMQGITPPRIIHTEPCMQGYPPTVVTNPKDTTVSFVIASDGTVKDIKLVESSGVEVLDKAFTACVATWRYTPAKKDGIPIDLPRRASVSWLPASAP